MANVSTRPKTLETPFTSIHQQQQINDNGDTHKLSGYEQSREERIKENLQRMQKLGIIDLSLKLKSLNPTPKNRNTSYNRKTPQRISPLPPSGPVRRSSRLQNTTPVSYIEVNLTKKDQSLEGEQDLIREGSRPEIYTEEHEKLLGDTKMPWTLFVDGYGNDGKRIYDSVRGKTCHQCRQKTLGHRTNCCKCNMLQGQFCGDCLYMRYGENVLEAKQNPDWICPVCRGICNCSLCRQAKGWPPTGIMYKKISNLGFKSVAHYLVQTRRANADSENITTSNKKVSAKRSLPFSDTDETCPLENVPPESTDHQGLEKPKSEDNITNHNDVMILKEEGEENLAQEDEKKNDDDEVVKAMKEEQIVDADVVVERIDDAQALSNIETQDQNDKEETIQVVENEQRHEEVTAKQSSVKSRKKPCLATGDSIGGRLRQRRLKGQ